ncbi:MAG: type IV secretion system protein, partial [Deltaproteobacteria bacterium]|nr:type IV secretion system protein [Deltaproteobacteria bacterium]
LFKKKSDAKEEGPVPDNPYLAARREWLERYGDYVAQAHNWRVMALTALLLCLLSAAGNVIQAMQYKVVPYVVAVDSLGGVHSSGVAKNLQPGQVPAVAIQAELANYVRNWRTVTADVDLQNRMLARLVAFSTSEARVFLQEWFQANNPFERAKNLLVAVDLKGLPQQVSQNAWRVEWTETSRNRQGKVMEQVKYEGTLSIGIAPPASEEDIMQNPLGIMVGNIYFSRLLQQ